MDDFPWVAQLVERAEWAQRDTMLRVLLAQLSIATSRHVLHRVAGFQSPLFGTVSTTAPVYDRSTTSPLALIEPEVEVRR